MLWARGLAGYDVAFTPLADTTSDNKLLSNQKTSIAPSVFSGLPNPFLFTKNELDRYIKEESLGLSDKTIQWKKKIGQVLWDHTQGILNEDTISQLREYVINHYASKDARLKIIYFVRKFLQEQSLKKGYQLEYLRSKFTLPKSLRVRQINQRIITDIDINNLIKHIESSDLSVRDKDEFITLVLFLVYTGQRPIVAETLEVRQISGVLDKQNPCIEVLGEQDKTRLTHHVPLHPLLVTLLTKHIKGKKDNVRVFRKNVFMRWLTAHPLKLLHTIGNIFVKDLRKYFEQKSDLLDFNETYKNMIMCHGLSTVQFRSYKQVTQEALYEKYVEKWGEVLFYPFN